MGIYMVKESAWRCICVMKEPCINMWSLTELLLCCIKPSSCNISDLFHEKYNLCIVFVFKNQTLRCCSRYKKKQKQSQSTLIMLQTQLFKSVFFFSLLSTTLLSTFFCLVLLIICIIFRLKITIANFRFHRICCVYNVNAIQLHLWDFKSCLFI